MEENTKKSVMKMVAVDEETHYKLATYRLEHKLPTFCAALKELIKNEVPK